MVPGLATDGGRLCTECASIPGDFFCRRCHARGGATAGDFLLFGRWLDQRLAAVDHPDHVRLLQQFATWHVLRRLRARAERGRLGPAPTNEARQQVNQAAAFMTWLAGRGRGLSDCTRPT
jgi:hypothetical protein